MNIFDAAPLSTASFVPLLNTGSPLDVATGKFRPGLLGASILDGGLSGVFGCGGRGQLFKSTIALGFGVNALARYRGSQMVVRDTEHAQQEERLLRLRDPHVPPIENSDIALRITSPAQLSLESFAEWVGQLVAKKVAERDAWEVETPFVDHLSGKRVRMMRPTIIAVDSITKDTSEAVTKVMDKTKLGTSEQNMIAMKDALIKTRMVSQMPGWAAKAGIYFILTAHVGDKTQIDPYAPNPKTLQHMNNVDKFKGAGADFTFLTSTLLQMRSAALLQNKEKTECFYPDAFTSPVDLSQVNAVVVRCKNNVSGTQLSPLVSQDEGMLAALTNYHYLKESDAFGLPGNDRVRSPIFLPDVKLQRTTVREKLLDPKTARAIEILFQLCFIRSTWSLRDMAVPFTMEPQELFDKLQASTYAIDDILTSRGYWTYEDADLPPYLSVMDILAIVTGQYRPSFWSVVPIPLKTKKADASVTKMAA